MTRAPSRHARRPARRQAFTFVELLIVSGVVFILIGGMTLALAESGRRLWMQSDADIATLNDAQRALLRVEEDLRGARQANLVCTAAASASCLTPPCLQFDPVGGGARLTYQRTAAGRLTRTPEAGAAQVVASGLSEFLPICQANGLVKLRVTAQIDQVSAGTSYVLSRRAVQSQAHVQNP